MSEDAKSKTADNWAPCGAGLRNRYFAGKKMKAAAYSLEQDYGIGRRRLLSRSILGWGVVRGFGLTLADKGAGENRQEGANRGGALTVAPGFALDRHGREIGLEAPVVLGPRNTVLLKDGPAGNRCQKTGTFEPGRYVLAIHYAERPAGTVMAADCGCDDPQHDQVCETAVFSLRMLDEHEACPCGDPDCAGLDGCHSGSACGDDGRGPQMRLCAWADGRTDAGAGPSLADCDGLAVDAGAPVNLGCVTIAGGGGRCEPVLVDAIEDACGPRRLVKTNDLLYDLIRGCDLTRIRDVSWRAHHRRLDWANPVPWEDFAELLPPASQGGGTPPDHDPEKITADEDGSLIIPHASGFRVHFTAQVLSETLLPDVMTITIFTIDGDSGWRIGHRLPVVALQPLDENVVDGRKVASGFVALVDPGWVPEEGKRASYSAFQREQFLVEISVHGSLIVDCSGQAVDADHRGRDGLPSGNGSPGGTFQSSFLVDSMPTQRLRQSLRKPNPSAA